MTQKAKPTPGPWTQGTSNQGRTCVWIDGHTEPASTMGLPDTWIDCVTEANARLIAAAPKLLDSHEPERGGADFLDWVADRLVNVYGESEDVDFVICLRRRAVKAREAISQAMGV